MKGLQVEELYGLDETLLHELEPIFGLIFLFKWDSTLEGAKRRKSMATVEDDEGSAEAAPFFASQTVQNACATQAILSILMNLSPTAMGVELGPELVSFKDFCAGLTPELRGEAIGANEAIRRIHNSFARPELAILDRPDRQQRGEREEDAFHFISLMPIRGQVYEFDGLQPAPIHHEMSPTTGSAGDSAWLATALRVIEEKIAAIQGATAAGGEIRFNLMAVIRDRAILYRERIDAQVRLVCQLETELRSRPPQGNPNDDPRQQQLQLLLASNNELEVRLEEEQARNARWARENAYRRHNFIPLAISLLRELVKSGRADKFLA